MEDRTVEGASPVGNVFFTFADAIALLLAFFVMLFSMSEIKMEKWDQIVSVQSSPEKLEEEVQPQLHEAKSVSKFKLKPALSLDYLAHVLEEHLTGDILLRSAIVHRLDGLVIISLPSDTMFASGEIELQKNAKDALFRMGDVIASIGNRIDVRGHTDPELLSDKQFDSKWVISLARAAAVANELRRTGYSRQLPIYALADTRFNDLDAQIPEKIRYKLARRVDIVIHPHSGRL